MTIFKQSFSVFIILGFILASGDEFSIRVEKKLNNEMLFSGDVVDFRIFYNCSKDILLTVYVLVSFNVVPPNSDVRLYFANDEKNILEVLLNSDVIGYRYETPHGNAKILTGFPVIKNEVEPHIIAMIPSEWFPERVSRISASVEVNTEIRNYYGILNYNISIPDKMIVEMYKKFRC